MSSGTYAAIDKRGTAGMVVSRVKPLKVIKRDLRRCRREDNNVIAGA